MKSCPKMQEVIEELAKRHGIDLTRRGAYFRLDMPGFDRLSVEHFSFSRIAVAHYFEQNGDLVPDPEVVFFVGDKSLGWVPIEVTQVIGGWRSYAQFSSDGSQIVSYNKERQASLAEFAEMWALNIELQEWLEHGVKYSPPSQASLPTTRLKWPEPTVEEPDFDTLEDWMWEDGGCEATDGCWIEPDGVCMHGHPSWLLKLGFI